MAGDKGENVLNMSQAELKLIALGCRFSDGGKPDYEQIAKYGGYTKGSAQVLYRKALRKLTDAWPVEGDAAASATTTTTASSNTGNEPVTPSGKAKTPKTPRSRATGGRKRKDAGADDAIDDQDAMMTPSDGPETPFTPGAEGFIEAFDMTMETPTKKPKKTAAKQISSSFTPFNATNDASVLKDEPFFEPFIKTE